MLNNILGRIYYQSYTFTYSSSGKASPPGVGGLPLNVRCLQNSHTPGFQREPIPRATSMQLGFAINGVALCGTLAGQLFYGMLGDKMGRKPAYTFSLAMLIMGAIGSSMSFGTSRSQVIGTLCWWRFWLGFGIGGCYPLTAVLMSEYSATKSRGRYVAAVFGECRTSELQSHVPLCQRNVLLKSFSAAMQGIGYLVGAIVVMVVSSIFHGAHPESMVR